MKALLSIVLLTVIFAVYSCQSKVKKTVNIKVDSIQKPKPVMPISKAEADTERYEDSAMTKVEQLAEYKKLLDEFIKDEKNNPDTSEHLLVQLHQRPNADLKYYWVKIGYDNPDMFHTLLDFYVDPKDFTVYYYDIISDSLLTVDQWRKSGKDDFYQKK